MYTVKRKYKLLSVFLKKKKQIKQIKTAVENRFTQFNRKAQHGFKKHFYYSSLKKFKNLFIITKKSTKNLVCDMYKI